jgi:hypothetical protein
VLKQVDEELGDAPGEYRALCARLMLALPRPAIAAVSVPHGHDSIGQA